MSTPKKLSPAEAMRAVREQAARDAMDEVKALSEEELDAKLRAEGVDPAEAERQAHAAIEAALARVPGEEAEGAEPQHGFAVPASRAAEKAATKKGGARKTNGATSEGAGGSAYEDGAPRLRRRWAAPTVLLVAAGAAIVVGITNGAQIVAALRGDQDAGPAPSADASASAPAPVPVAPTTSPEADRSLALRHDALEACARADWSTCRTGLDQAKSVDPAGEDLPQVVAARRAIAQAVPKLGPK